MFLLILGGSDLVFLNWSQRSLPKGIQIGNQGRSRVLEIDGEFTRVKHFGIELQLHRTEVSTWFIKENMKVSKQCAIFFFEKNSGMDGMKNIGKNEVV